MNNRLSIIGNTSVWRLILLGVMCCYGHFAQGQSANENLKKENKIKLDEMDCLPKFEENNISIMCRELAEKSLLPAPLLNSDCRTIVQLEYDDQFYDLGCSVSGFSGYFNPARWTSTEVSGAGGVDVTGAPDPKLLVEGTNNDLIEVANGRLTRLDLVIPAKAYIRLKWEKIGSSTTITATPLSQLSVQINEKSIPLPHSKQEFFSPLLQAGDVLSIALNSQHSVLIKSFEFLSNASAVIERNWSATDDLGQVSTHTQYIAVERVNLNDVIFPEGKKLSIQEFSGSFPEIHPSLSGYPYIDKDGDPETSSDRIYLEPGTCELDLFWEDFYEMKDDGILLIRKWVIHDLCSRNTLEKLQEIDLKIEKKSVSSTDDISEFSKGLKQGAQGMYLDLNTKL